MGVSMLKKVLITFLFAVFLNSHLFTAEIEDGSGLTIQLFADCIQCNKNLDVTKYYMNDSSWNKNYQSNKHICSECFKTQNKNQICKGSSEAQNKKQDFVFNRLKMPILFLVSAAFIYYGIKKFIFKK